MPVREKIPVAILGATGAVGQRFARLLAGHPWFEVTAVAASERSAGRRYVDACQWVIPGDPPAGIAEQIVQPLEPNLPARILFSALPTPVAREIEPHSPQPATCSARTPPPIATCPMCPC